jgi:NAD(P)-dependent dehydrogenase (short-subunit alcohol dehydrogenase family)
MITCCSAPPTVSACRRRDSSPTTGCANRFSSSRGGLRGDLRPVREQPADRGGEEHVPGEVVPGLVHRGERAGRLVRGQHVEVPVAHVRRAARPRVQQPVHVRRDVGLRGFGRIWAGAALARGDRVAATARDPESLRPLADAYGDRFLPLRLDVTDRDAVFAAVRRAADAFGHLDVVVNNAGYGLFGMVEETTEPQARAQLDTNLLGPLRVTQAALPLLRERGSGHILQVSSLGGLAGFPSLGLYNASKWALEGMSEALAQEVAPFGVRVTIVEPGPYGTDWSGPSAVRTEPLPAYEPIREARRAGAAARAPQDPRATADVILELADAQDPPLRLFLGEYPYPVVEAAYRRRLETWDAWRPLAAKA